MLSRALCVFVAIAIAFASLDAGAQQDNSGVVRIGSKNFTEQEILGELIAQLIERTTDLRVERRLGLSGTNICHAALVDGEIDLYVEYTGTGLLDVLESEVIANPTLAYIAVSRAYRERWGITWLPPLGFENGYAISVRRDDAERLGLSTVSDLTAHQADLTGGFPSEFMERPDGYPGLESAYGLALGDVKELDPGLMYKAVADGSVDLISAFTTDGRIDAYDLFPLEDDRGFFPPYDAAPVLREGLLDEFPQLQEPFAMLAGAITEPEMRRMNYEVDELGVRPAQIANDWIDRRLGIAIDAIDAQQPKADRPSFFVLVRERSTELRVKTIEHLVITLIALCIAIVIGVPLGVAAHRVPLVRTPALATAEILQTIPSLAMFAFLFAIYGLLGAVPAVTALVLYALLPILLNTLTGLGEVPASTLQAADGVGLNHWQRLRLVELPLAMPVIVSGIRTSAVLTVGIATLATYIGAGGLGDFIARGLARSDAGLTMLGAVPAALMAVVFGLVIRAIERAVTAER